MNSVSYQSYILQCKQSATAYVWLPRLAVSTLLVSCNNRYDLQLSKIHPHGRRNATSCQMNHMPFTKHARTHREPAASCNLICRVTTACPPSSITPNFVSSHSIIYYSKLKTAAATCQILLRRLPLPLLNREFISPFHRHISGAALPLPCLECFKAPYKNTFLPKSLLFQHPLIA